MQNRSGFYTNNLSGEMAYKSFCPANLPPNPDIKKDEEMIELLVRANKAIALFNGICEHIPNIDVFISQYVRKEALMSSQIEGTQATLEDIFDPLKDDNVNLDVSEVINYIKAMEYAINRLNDFPLCKRFIKEIHKILMQGARGESKLPGEFRHSQNWIGGNNSNIRSARFIPPNHLDMEECLVELENYINKEDDTDYLIKVALIHYQFETIHPFLDGNGRVGRMLIVLYLLQNKVLSSPALYVSYFLKKNRTEYYDRLDRIRKTGDYEQWLKFFLLALSESAENAIDKIKVLHALIDFHKTIIEKQTTGTAIKKIYDYLLINPIIEIKKTANSLGITFKTVSTCVDCLCKLGILEEVSGKKRYRVFYYESYLSILRDGTELGG